MSGKVDLNSSNQNVNPANFISGDILTLKDVEDIQAVQGVLHASPLGLVSGAVKYEDKSAAPIIYGAYENILQAMEILPLEEGTMFDSRDAGNVIVLGRGIKDQLFDGVNAVGKKVLVGQEEFEVVGVLGKSKTAGVFDSEFDSVSLVPFDTTTRLNKDNVKIFRIIIKVDDEADVETVKNTIFSTLLDNHNQEEDFTVLTQDDLLGLFNRFLSLATTMISAIASISLIVGGIGIMNIMLVTVTERTREIGLRKAVGATKMAILLQFLTEAIMVTFVGSLLGLLISFGVGMIIASQTELAPVITLNVILVAVGGGR